MTTIRGKETEGAQLLAYGTLCFPSVMKSLLGYVPESIPCEAYGCRRYKIRDRVYPMLKIEPDGTIDDTAYIFRSLSESDWAILDAFEDPRYELVEVKTSQGPALAYVSCDESMQMDGSWLPSVFEQDHLREYVVMCERWRSKREPAL